MKTFRNISVIVSIFILSFIFSFTAHALTQTRSPGAYTNNGGDASFGVANLATSDNARNCVNLDNGDEAKGYFRNFGFTIPIGAVVTDISVVMEGVWGANGQRDEFKVKIRNNSTDDNSILDNKNYFSNAEATGTISSAVAGGKIFNLDVNPKWAYGEINGNNFGLEIESIKSKSNGGSFCFDYIAITVTYNAPCNPCYSIASGNFNAAATWSGTSGGVAETTVPVNDGSIEFIIENNRTVSLTAAFAVKSLTVGTAAGAGAGAGTLRWTSASNLDIYNAAGVTVNANGTLNANGQTNGGLDFDNLAGGTYAFVNNGTVTIPDLAVGNATLNLSGSSTITVMDDYLSRSNSVIINNNITSPAKLLITDDMNFGGFTATINNNAVIDINGEFMSIDPTEVTYYNYNGSTTTYAGLNTNDTDIIIAARFATNSFSFDGAGSQNILVSEYYNLIVTGSGVKTTMGGITVNNTLNVYNGCTLTIAGFYFTVVGTTTVGQGASGTLSISSAAGAKLFTGLVTIANGANWTNNTANSDVTFEGGILINTTGTFTAGSGINTLNTGDFTNHGTFTHNSGTVTFTGTAFQQITGGALTAFNNLTVNKGTDITSIVEAVVGGSGMSMAGNLTLSNGLLRLTHAAAQVRFSNGNTIVSTAGLHINGGSLTHSGNGTLTNNGLFQLTSGTATVGTATGNCLNTSSTGTLTIEGGTLNVAGRLRTTGGTATISNGTITVGTVAWTHAAEAAFEASATTVLTITGSPSIIFQNANANAGGTDVLITTGLGLKSITGGTLQFGNASTPITQTFKISSQISVYNILVFGTNSPIAQLVAARPIIGSNNITINATGTLDANNENITLAGNWTNNGGTFTPGTATVTFNSATGAQAITGTSATQSFNNITVAKTAQTLSVSGSTTTLNASGTVTLTSGVFAAGTAATINMTGNGGNWTNNGGTFTPGTGTVVFNNTAGGQEINGTAVTQSFNSVTVAKTAQALTISGATTTLNASGTVTLTSGVFATGTALPTIINMTGNGGNWTNNGGTFVPNAGTVVFNNTAGAQAINGTSATQSFNNITVAKTAQTLSVSGSTTTLNASGTVTLTSGVFAAGTAATINMTGNGGNWTNNGGTFTPGTGVVVFNNTAGAQAINGTAATQSFNRITVAKTAQTLSVAGSTTTLNASGTVTLTSGTFAAGTAATINMTGGAGNWTNNGGIFTPGTGTVVFNNAAANQSINGTTATQSFNNITMVKPGRILSVSGSTTTLNISGTLTLTSGTFLAGTAATINMTGNNGNWTNNGGTFTPGTGEVVFSSTANQAINGTNLAAENFNNLTINKSAGGIVTCNDVTLSAAGILNFAGSNGFLDIVAGKTVTINDPSKVTGYSYRNFIIVGSLTGGLKMNNVAGGSSAFFPIGSTNSTNNYAPAQITNNTGVTEPISASLCTGINVGGTCGGVIPGTVNYTWDITSTCTNATVKYFWHSSQSNLLDVNKTAVIHHTGAWVRLPGGFSAQVDESGPIAAGFYSRSGVQTSFSPGGVKDTSIALPIALTSFTGKVENSQTVLSWVTATETNNNYFVLEKSDDGINFTETARIEGAGNSQTEKKYEFTDNSINSDLVYYRLTQVDYDGKSTSFPIIALNGNGNKTSSSLDAILYPNPVDKGGVVKVKFNEDVFQNSILISIVDVIGNQYYLKADFICCDTYTIYTENLSAGVYYIIASQKDSMINKTLVIH